MEEAIIEANEDAAVDGIMVSAEHILPMEGVLTCIF